MGVREIRPEPAGTVVAPPRWVAALCWIGLPAAGAGLGWSLIPLVDWLIGLGWLPLPGVVRAVTELPRPHAAIGAAALGALGGAALAYQVALDALRVTVGDHAVRLHRVGGHREVPRATVSAVFLDGDRLVLLGRDTEELARERHDLPAAALAAAFGRHGWPWRADGDPYRDRFRRWVPEHAELPAGADALLKARQKALDSGDAEDADELRAELARLGVVVRDEKKRQYWRPGRPPREQP